MAYPNDDENARRIIERARQESGGVLTSYLARTVRHFVADDADSTDRVDFWGRRMGRALAALFLTVLIVFVLVQSVDR